MLTFALPFALWIGPPPPAAWPYIAASLLTHIEDHDDVVIIREEFLIDGATSVRQSIELAVGVMYRVLQELLGPEWQPRQVCFAHRPPVNMTSHRALFGPQVRASKNSVTIYEPNSILRPSN